MKLIDILKNEKVCKFSNEAKSRLKNGQIKLDGIVVREDTELNIKGEIIDIDIWFNTLSDTHRKQLIFLVALMNGKNIDILFAEKDEPFTGINHPVIDQINKNEIFLLQIAKREKFILI